MGAALEIGRFEGLGRALDRCESPAERRFLAALVLLDDFGFEPYEHGSIVARDDEGTMLHQQLEMLDGRHFRADFAFVNEATGARLAIEVDGAQHCEPDQARRDRARDRLLLAYGWPTIRFMARDVFISPVSCVGESLKIFARMHQPPPVRLPGLVKAALRPSFESGALSIDGIPLARDAGGSGR